MLKKMLLISLLSGLITTTSLSAWLFDFDNFFKEFDKVENQILKTLTKINFSTTDISIYKSEKDQTFVVKASIPGFNKEDFKIKIDDKGYLTISAENKKEQHSEEKDEKNNVYLFRSSKLEKGSFKQMIHLPDYVEYKNPQKIETTYTNGILKIKFPLKPEAKTKEITLQITSNDSHKQKLDQAELNEEK